MKGKDEGSSKQSGDEWAENGLNEDIVRDPREISGEASDQCFRVYSRESCKEFFREFFRETHRSRLMSPLKSLVKESSNEPSEESSKESSKQSSKESCAESFKSTPPLSTTTQGAGPGGSPAQLFVLWQI